MAAQSAGLLMYRPSPPASHEVFLVHPGGPYWVRKDLGSWGIPKGEYLAGEDSLSAAIREFTEETGFAAEQPFFELGSVKQPGGKVVVAWAFAGDCDPAQLRSNTCSIEWPPRSGTSITIAEVDRGAWFSFAEARAHILKGQMVFLDRLEELLRNACG